ncbi:hypothetical protein AB0M28_37975 [Streptomyces sp. NPDC051940]|uniref:hypothetical protein n=1 Tax=Streptomyces sp. NPDC051940 TaxID=3155675 RepID=UPI00343C234F
MRGRVVAGGAVAVVAGIATAVVGLWPAQAAWTSGYRVSPSGWTATDSPQVSVDRQGDALQVWTACDAAASSCYHQVQAKIKRADGTVTTQRTLSPLGAVANWPQADSDDDGDSAVVWEQDGQVVGRRISAAGSLVGSLRQLSTSGPATTPAVAVAPTGTAMAVWTEIRDGSWYAVARKFLPDGTAGPAITLGNSSGEMTAIGVDRSGRFVVAWVNGQSVLGRRIGADSTLSATKTLTSAIEAYAGFGRPRVAVDRDGDAVVTYRSGGGTLPQLWVSRWSRTGTLQNSLRVSASTDNVGNHSTVAMDLDGDAMIVWAKRGSDGKLVLAGRKLTAAGSQGVIHSLGSGDRPDIALDDDGDGMLVYHTPEGPYVTQKVSARLVARDGVFGAVRTVTSTDGRVPQVSARPTARFNLVWQRQSYPYSIFGAVGP